MTRGEGGDEGLVLLVDDDRELGELFRLWLKRSGFRAEVRGSAEEGLAALERLLPEAVLLDLSLPGLSGLDALSAIRERSPRLPVVILTGDRSVETVVSAMRLGAYNYLAKPVDETRLVTEVRNAVERYRLSLRLAHLEREVAGAGYAGILGRSAAMRELFRQMDRVAPSEITVLIHGESGTGKELVARALHASSSRRGGPFVALSCAAIPEALQESEMFGHEKGAFTSAVGRRLGRFEQADGGTLFLDEVAELSPALQAKLLRAIQERSFYRVGGSTEVRSDFRLISATHRRLDLLAERGEFRRDLYYRLAVFELEIPPLRDRLEDLPALCDAILDGLRKASSTPDVPLRLSPGAVEALRAYAWPGNVRELENALQRAAVVAAGGELRREDLPVRVLQSGSTPAPVPAAAEAAVPRAAEAASAVPPEGRARIDDLDTVERRAIEDAYRRTEGNVSAMARQLGVGRGTLYRKLRKYGLTTEEGP